MKLYSIEKLCEWLENEAKICVKNITSEVKKERFDDALKLKVEADTYLFIAQIISNETEIEEICG